MDKYVELFLQTEEKYNLFDVPFAGENIWMYLRLEVFRLIERQILRSNLVPVPYRQVFLNDNSFWTDEEKNSYEESVIRSRQGCDFLVINNKHRFVMYQGDVFCPITGMLAQLFPYRFAFCTQVYNRGKFQRYDHENDINHNKIAKKPRLFFDEPSLEAYVAMLASLFGDAYQMKLEPPFYKDVAAHIRYVSDMMSYSDFYARLLRETRPKAVIVSSYYATIDALIIAEADRLGIPTIEIQHGTIGNEHVAYNFLRKPRQTDCLPDYLASYGQFEQEALRNFVAPGHMIPIGNLFLNRIRRDLMQAAAPDPQKKNVLIVSFNMDNAKLVDFTLDLKKLRPQWEITYRFHPEEKIEEATVRALSSAGVICAMDFQVSIYMLIMQSDYIIGTKSTVLYEAMCFGKPSYVLQTEEDLSQWREAEKRMPHIRSAQEFLRTAEHPDSEDSLHLRSAYFYRQNGEDTMAALLAAMAERRD